jgi:hypothetical protein
MNGDVAGSNNTCGLSPPCLANILDCKIILYYFIFVLQADRGCAVGAIFWGAGGVGEGCYALRATDFREERNPPQADIIVSVF